MSIKVDNRKIVVEKEVRIPETDIILEKGDVVEVLSKSNKRKEKSLLTKKGKLVREEKNKLKEVDKKKASYFLERMEGYTTYITVRGTTGDADMTVEVDNDIIKQFKNESAFPATKAPSDVKNDFKWFIKKFASNTTIDEYFYAENEDAYILLWD